jgi:ectoine hydroxylase-related dioxygenase (phytanoyl-CoA dioxygenase family)
MRKLLIGTENVAATSSGLAQFSVIPQGGFVEGDALVVSAPGMIPARVCPVPSEAFRVNVHTHYLGSGTHHVSFCLEDVAGNVVFTAAIPISLEFEGDLARVVRHSLLEAGVPFAYSGLCDSSIYPFNDSDVRPWFDREDADQHIDKLLQNRYIDQAEAQLLRGFVRDGYIMIEALIDDELISKVNAEIDEVINIGYQGYTRGSSTRIEHLHKTRDAIRQLWLDRRHLRFADLLFNAQARPSQTLVFVCGSQQRAHQDLIHLTPFPAGYMCGTWIALQDIQPNSGELVVYPGSHRDRAIYMRDTHCAKVTNGDWHEFGDKAESMYGDMAMQYQPVVYRPKKGSVLIWHSSLVHGGSVREDKELERRSMVIHSFADGALVFYDSTGSVGTVVEREALGHQ